MRSMTKGAKIMANWDLDNGPFPWPAGYEEDDSFSRCRISTFPWPPGYKDDVWEDDPDEFADEDDEEEGE